MRGELVSRPPERANRKPLRTTVTMATTGTRRSRVKPWTRTHINASPDSVRRLCRRSTRGYRDVHRERVESLGSERRGIGSAQSRQALNTSAPQSAQYGRTGSTRSPSSALTPRRKRGPPPRSGSLHCLEAVIRRAYDLVRYDVSSATYCRRSASSHSCGLLSLRDLYCMLIARRNE